MDLDSYARALALAQGLVPDYDQQRALQLENRQRGFSLAQAQQAQRNVVDQQVQANERQRQIDADLSTFHSQPSSEAAVRLITTYPELRDPIKDAWALQEASTQRTQLSQFAQVRAAIANGRPDLAKSIIQRHIDADTQAGRDVSADRDMLSMIDDDPTRFAANLDGMIAAISGPEKVASATKDFADASRTLGENRRADQVQPAVVRKGVAEAQQAETTAQYAPQIIQSNLATDEARRRDIASQIDTRAGQLQLGRDTLESNVQLKLEEYERNGLRPDPGSAAMMNNAVISGSASAALAEQTRDLADQFAASPTRGGFYSGLAETSKSFFGSQDAVSVLRSRYAQLRNSAAIKSLPPGPASDKDIKIAREGFPPPTAPREYIVSWLRGMAKMQDIAAAHDNARADWIASNGNLGTAKRDLLVNGVQVPAGTSFIDYQKRTASTARRQNIPPRSYMEFAR